MIRNIRRLVCLAGISRSPPFHIISKSRAVPEQLMSVELTTNMENESPTRYMLSEESVCVPKQEKEEDAMKDYSYNPYSAAKYPTIGKKRKRALKKEKFEKKPKVKKIKQEPEGMSQRTLDEWLKKDTTLKGILKKQSSASSRSVSFLFKVKVRNVYKNGNLSKKTHFLDLTLEEDCAKRNTPFALKRREQKKEQKRRHYLRRQQLKPRRVRIVTHILKTMLRENALLGL